MLVFNLIEQKPILVLSKRAFRTWQPARRATNPLRKDAKPAAAAEVASKGTPYKRIAIGVPKEVWPKERRVSLTPAVTATLVKKGFQVRVEKGAGLEAKFRDAEYEASGAKLVDKNAAYQSGSNDSSCLIK